MRSPLTTSTERERAFLLVSQRSLVIIRTHTHRGSTLMFAPFTFIHMVIHACAALFDLDPPFLFPVLPSTPFPLPQLLEVW